MVSPVAWRDESGYATPEEASCADIPQRFVTVVGTELDGDSATVWLLTNDRPPFEDDQGNCVRDNGRWHADSGFPFNDGTPDEILEQARSLGWTGH
jgi:hypothetical protein